MSIQGEKLVASDSNELQYNQIINQLNLKISKLTENYDSVKDVNLALREK